MDVSLTDILACPHCGPPFALILLADRVEERRVLAGTLGCANCYRRYLVREGAADLRAGPGGEASPAAPAPEPPEPATDPAQARSPTEAAERAEATSAGSGPSGVTAADHAYRLAALMGLSDASGGAGRPIALLAGPVAAEARAVAAVAEGYEIAAAAHGGEAGAEVARLAEAGGVSRMLVAGRLPFFDGSLRGVALSGEAADRLLEEGVRVLNPMGRLVVEGAPAHAAARIVAAGGRVVAAEGETVVAISVRAVGAGP